MNLYALPPLIAALVYLLVAFLVYFKNKTSPINRSFALMLLCVCIWNVNWAGIIGGPNPDFVRIWGKIFRSPHLFIPPTFLHFTLLFTNPNGISRRSRQILLIFYGLSFFMATISWTRPFEGELIAYSWGYSFKSGPLYGIFIGQFISAVFIAFYHLVRGYLRAESYLRQRLKYFFLAVILSFSLGSFNFLPILGVGVYPLGNIAVSIGLFVAAYSVVHHRLMDVSVFMAKGVAYLLSMAILAIPAVIILIFLERYFFHEFNVPFSMILLAMGTVAVLVFGKVKEYIDRATHLIIFRGKYDYLKVLEDFTRRLVTIVDLNRLLNMLADTIEKSMGVNQLSIFLQDAEKEAFKTALIRGSPGGEVIKLSQPCIEYLQEKREVIVRAEVENTPQGSPEEELFKMMERFAADLFLPLVYTNRMTGFIHMGPKPTKEVYHEEELDLLNFMANQMAIAIENANLYENLKKSQGIMRRADRLASLGTLIASLAHEIRNPLVSIKTFTQLLPERIDDEEFRNYFLKVASGEIDRLTSLINELLGFARPSEPRLEGEDVNALIDKMEVLIATEARKKNVSLTKNYAQNLPEVKVDAEQIKQVLLNILLNAIQAIPGEGKIWVETRQVPVTTDGKTDSYIQIEIRDTGVGIPKENLDRIFDPFFSTRSEGSGLGLAISHQIVHDHGGFISVESQVGKGTSFRVHLPLEPPGGKVGSRK